ASRGEQIKLNVCVPLSRDNVIPGIVTIWGATASSRRKSLSSSFSHENRIPAIPTSPIYFKKRVFIKLSVLLLIPGQLLVTLILYHIRVGCNLFTWYRIKVQMWRSSYSSKYSTLPLPVIGTDGKLTKAHKVCTTMCFVIRFSCTFVKQEPFSQFGCSDIA